MAALQKFKILATQCGVVQSPTRSPRTSPVVHFPRKKTTLRMLLTRTTSSRARSSVPNRGELTLPTTQVVDENEKKKEEDAVLISRNQTQSRSSLKDLFVSSSTYDDKEEENTDNGKFVDRKIREEANKPLRLGGEPGSSKPVWAGFRHRLLRKAWRPMLVTIAE